MDIASVGAASIEMNLAKTQEAVGVAVLKNAMELQENSAMAFLKMTPPPSFGHQLAMYV